MIGAIYYIGMLCFIIIVPMIADKFGRKWVFQINFFIFIIATIGILFANDLISLYIFLFISGATIGGRSVVGINYMLEFQ
jgi:MFS family permease